MGGLSAMAALPVGIDDARVTLPARVASSTLWPLASFSETLVLSALGRLPRLRNQLAWRWKEVDVQDKWLAEGLAGRHPGSEGVAQRVSGAESRHQSRWSHQ
jgi:hypothetical protein